MSPNFFRKFLNFIQYHNAFVIIFVLIFVGFSVSLAASPDLRDNVYSSQQKVISIDNSRILSIDLDNFNFNLKIDAVTEDNQNYYVAYSFQTIAVKVDAWQDVLKKDVLTVNKEGLAGADLGLYVAKQLGDNINYQSSYLKKVQEQEKKKGASQKIVSTQYSGLVGKLFDSKEEFFPGYQPIVSPTTSEDVNIVSVPPMQIAPTASENLTDINEKIDEDRVRQIVQEMLAQNQDLTSPISTSSPVIVSESSSSEIMASSTNNDSAGASDQTIPITPEVENLASTTL